MDLRFHLLLVALILLMLAPTSCGQQPTPAAAPSPALAPEPSRIIEHRPPGKRLEATSSPRALELCGPKQPSAPGSAGNCKRWRLALEEACGARDQPSRIDPCRCLCDRCLADRDCKTRSGGRCIQLPSTLSGQSPEHLCVYPGDACGGPNPACPGGKLCWTAGGTPACAKPFEPGR